MAATLSAEEEQVGLEILYAHTYSFLCYIALHVPASARPGGILALCIACAHRGELATAVRNGFVAKWSRMWSGNIVSISRALLLSLHYCQFLSRSWRAESVLKRAELAFISPHRCEMFISGLFRVVGSWLQTVILHRGGFWGRAGTAVWLIQEGTQ